MGALNGKGKAKAAEGDDDDFDDFQSATPSTTASNTATSTMRPAGNSMAGLFDAPVQPTAARGTMPTTQPNYSSLSGFNLSSTSASQPLRSNQQPPSSHSSFGMGMGMGITSPPVSSMNLGFSSVTPTASGFTSPGTNYQPNYFSQPTATATVFFPFSLFPPICLDLLTFV